MLVSDCFLLVHAVKVLYDAVPVSIPRIHPNRIYTRHLIPCVHVSVRNTLVNLSASGFRWIVDACTQLICLVVLLGAIKTRIDVKLSFVLRSLEVSCCDNRLLLDRVQVSASVILLIL